MVEIQELASIQMSLVVDRGTLKFRGNIVKGNRIFGFLRPVERGK